MFSGARSVITFLIFLVLEIVEVRVSAKLGMSDGSPQTSSRLFLGNMTFEGR